MSEQVKVSRQCPKCKGKGEYYFQLPDDVGSPNLVKCEKCKGTGYLEIKRYGLPPDAGQRRM